MSLTDRDRSGLGPASDQDDRPLDEDLESPVDLVPHHESHVTLRRITPLRAESTTATAPARPAEGEDRPVRFARIGRTGDILFRGASLGSSWLIIAIVVFVGIFLLWMAVPSLADNKVNFLTSREWSVDDPTNLRFGIANLLWTTVLVAVVALVIAVPISIGVALFITQYAPRRLAGPFAFLVDLLAAVPSIVFGLWGLIVLSPHMTGISDLLQNTLGKVPVLGALFGPGVSSGSVLTAAVVLAIMIIPIVTAISRDVFAQTPTDHLEAALALGATRWEKITLAVLPYGRSGVVSAAMLGLGRALGETIAVMIILSTPAPGEAFNPSIFAGGETFASKIANNAQEFDTPTKTGAYIAAGLVLFVVTFAVNGIARLISSRGTVKA